MKHVLPSFVVAIAILYNASIARSEILLNLGSVEDKGVSREIGVQLYEVIGQIFQALKFREQGDADKANGEIWQQSAQLFSLSGRYRQLSTRGSSISLETVSSEERSRISRSFEIYRIAVPYNDQGLVELGASEIDLLASELKGTSLNGGKEDIPTIREIYNGTFRLLDVGASIASIGTSQP